MVGNSRSASTDCLRYAEIDARDVVWGTKLGKGSQAVVFSGKFQEELVAIKMLKLPGGMSRCVTAALRGAPAAPSSSPSPFARGGGELRQDNAAVGGGASGYAPAGTTNDQTAAPGSRRSISSSARRVPTPDGCTKTQAPHRMGSFGGMPAAASSAATAAAAAAATAAEKAGAGRPPPLLGRGSSDGGIPIDSIGGAFSGCTGGGDMLVDLLEGLEARSVSHRPHDGARPLRAAANWRAKVNRLYSAVLQQYAALYCIWSLGKGSFATPPLLSSPGPELLLTTPPASPPNDPSFCRRR